MLRTIERIENVDAEARLLARVYALILSWSEPRADDERAGAGSNETRRNLTREKSEVNDLGK